MQSFAYQVKSELCRVPVQRICCARAEAYGVLLYCNTFNAREIRIITENPEFAKRLPKLFHRAFNLRFDRLPGEQEGREKLIFQINDPAKLERIISQFGYEAKQTLALQINFGVLEEDCRRRGIRVCGPPLSLCGDNAAMIGAQGYYELLAGNIADLSLNAVASKKIEIE